MDDTELWAEVAKYLGLAGVGTGSGVGIAFVLRWAYRRLFEEGLATQRATWEVEFVQALRGEIERQATVSRTLYEQANDMHHLIVELVTENIRLKTQLAERQAGTHEE